ncbi:MAG: aminotransferase class IV, partial [Ignavibacteria bacterium]|nr:aminotransferase class IV [Ignavibacteria bacterium]
QKEYDEALLKSRFLTSPAGYFKIFETMLVKKNQVIFINEHIERLKNAASFFLFKFDEEKIISEILINIESIDGRKDYRYRLSLTKWGELIHQVNEYKKFDSEVKVIISSVQVNSQSQYLYFKTTNRQLYESEYARYLLMGFFDVLFFNEKGELTEGAITNIFVKIGEEIFTPPSKCGLLTGIYRNYYIDTHSNIQRKIISLEDLYNADEIILTNSLRGEIKVDVLYFNEKEFKSFNLKKSKDKS